MRKEYNLTCSCGASANFSIEKLENDNGFTFASMMTDLKKEVDEWQKKHDNCLPKENSNWSGMAS